MKSNIIFNSTLIIMLTFFGACDVETDAGDIKKVIIQEIEGLCSEQRDGTLTHEIDGVCAETSIHAYDQYIKDVKLNLGIGHAAKLVRGAKVNRDELQQLADLLENDSTAVPYIMLAFKEDSNGVYTDMIFTIQSGEGTSHSDYRYFDFTQPCPTYCPKRYSYVSDK